MGDTIKKGKGDERRLEGRRRGGGGDGEKKRPSTTEGSGDLSVRITVIQKDLTQMSHLQRKVIIVTDPKGSQSKSFENSLFLVRMVVGGGMKVAISMGGFAEDTMTKGALCFLNDQDIKKRKEIFQLNFLGERYAQK